MKSLLSGCTWIVAIALGFLLWVPLAEAHPLGNFTINHYAGLKVAPDGIGIDYVLDMAEIPAFQEIHRLDTNHNRVADPAETIDYPAERCHAINAQLALQMNGQPLAIVLHRSNVEFPPGVGGLATLRLSCDFRGVIPDQTATFKAATSPQQIEFADQSYPQRLGWREITVTADDVPIQGNVTATSITKRLTDYPTDLLSSPLNQRQIAFQINPSLTADAASAPPAGQSTHASSPPSVQPATFLGQTLAGRSNDAFTNLITLKELNLPTVLLALAIAFVWGGFHALSPGHGKTVVGAYLVGARSNISHALLLGLTVTLTHTAGIFALGILMLGASEFVLTEQLFPWLSVVSGVLVTAIGLNLFINRLRNVQMFSWGLKPGFASHPPVHEHPEQTQRYRHQEHHHSHDHHQGHYHSHNHEHSHSHEPNHEHSSHSHSHPPHLPHSHPHHHTHSHLPPGADGSPVTWSSILALGISGGILPCPSALVVLLSAIAIGRTGFGLVLVSAFSLGLAAVLTGIGLLLVYAKHWFERMPLQSPKSKLFPAVSALLMTLIGIGITTQALLVHTL